MEVLNWYIMLDGTHAFKGITARKGQRILLTDKEAQRLGARVRRWTMADEKNDEKVTETAKPTYEPTFQPIEGTETVKTTATINQSTTNQTTRDWSKSQEMKAVDLIYQVNETNSVEDLEALYDIEEKGQNRVTVLREIEKKVAQLEGEGK